MNADDPVAIARQLALGEILQATLAEWRTQPKPWDKLTQAQQADLEQKLLERVRLSLTKAVHIIASDARTCFVSHVKDVVFKSDKLVEAKLVIPNSEGSHELADYAGGQILVVLEDARRYVGDGA